MNKTNRPKYTAVNKPSPPPIPVLQMAVRDAGLSKCRQYADQPQEILAFDSLRPLPPPSSGYSSLINKDLNKNFLQ